MFTSTMNPHLLSPQTSQSSRHKLRPAHTLFQLIFTPSHPQLLQDRTVLHTPCNRICIQSSYSSVSPRTTQQRTRSTHLAKKITACLTSPTYSTGGACTLLLHHRPVTHANQSAALTTTPSVIGFTHFQPLFLLFPLLHLRRGEE